MLFCDGVTFGICNSSIFAFLTQTMISLHNISWRIMLIAKIMSEMRIISIKVGISMLFGFIATFGVVYILGFAQYTELRILNGFVHLSCLYIAIRAYYKVDPQNVRNYMLGVMQGMGASVIGVVGYAIFMAIFMKIDAPLMNTIKENSPIGIYLNPISITLFVLVEGLGISLIGSYILTRFYGSTIKAV
jgi:hypothetical protein